MGIEQTTYLGPYILIENGNLTEEKKNKYNPQTGEEFEIDVNFDPYTGEELKEKTKEEKIEGGFCWMDFYDLYLRDSDYEGEESLEDLFTTVELGEKYICFVLVDDDKYHYEIDCDGEVVKDVPFEFAVNSYTMFERDFAQIINKMKEVFPSVEVKFGLITYVI